MKTLLNDIFFKRILQMAVKFPFLFTVIILMGITYLEVMFYPIKNLLQEDFPTFPNFMVYFLIQICILLIIYLFEVFREKTPMHDFYVGKYKNNFD